jgi:gamma-glutamyltranspeptidase/glutathione hydrolase
MAVSLQDTSKTAKRAAMGALALALGACSLPGLDTTPAVQPGEAGFVRGFLGGVAAEEPRAAIVARNVLSAGGTAVDAAVAAGFMLSVTLPSRAGLGGGGACLVFNPARNEAEAVLFPPGARAAAPAGADRPAAIPMMARGLFALHVRGGRRPFEELVTPAEQVARLGAEVGRALAADLAAVSGPLLADPAARAAFVAATGPAALVQRISARRSPVIRTAGRGRPLPGSRWLGGWRRPRSPPAAAERSPRCAARWAHRGPAARAGRAGLRLLPAAPADGGGGCRRPPSAQQGGARRRGGGPGGALARRARLAGPRGGRPAALLAAAPSGAPSWPALAASTGLVVLDRAGQGGRLRLHR